MSHFAQVENGIVTQVIVAEQDFIDTLTGTWVQTSYNTRGGIHYNPDSKTPDGKPQLRYNYAGIGCIYDQEADAFYTQQPYPSWVLNTTTYLWEAPFPKPSNDFYIWDEETTSWIKPQENN